MDSACDITQCDIWAIEIDTCYGFEQVDSFPSMEIAMESILEVQKKM